MGDSVQNSTTDYALFWLEHGGKAIRQQPSGQGGVSHWTHRNYSGGCTGWEAPMNEVYFRPSSLEQRLLQGHIHALMLEALNWAIRQAECKTPYQPWEVWNSMDLAEAYRLSHMVVQVDPALACVLKIRLNQISSRTGKNLAELADMKFMTFMGPSTGIEW